MERKKFDCVIIGGGPGGYVAAIRAAQRGLTTAIVEAKHMGGTCLNRGCIPSKALIAHAEALRKVKKASQFGISTGPISFNYAEMNNRKETVVKNLRGGIEGLIASNKISAFRGLGKFLSPHEVKVSGVDDVILEASSFIIATGSEPRSLPIAPFDYQRIHDSTSFLELTTLPQTLIIVGGGIIGCEFACLHRAFDVDVTILEILPTILTTEGKSVSETLSTLMKKQGIKIETEILLDKLENVGDKVVAHLRDGRKIEADMALVSVGRKLNSDGIGLEKTGVIVEKNGSIPTNDQMQTNVSHIYAIGDVQGKWLLAHVASHQGLVAADNIAGHQSQMSYIAVPSVTFTHPEAATVGLTLERALEAGFDAKIGKFPFIALGKSQALMETDGFAQIVVEKTTGQILGAQVVGYQASTLIAEIAVAIQHELTVESIGETVHAHPTLAESWMESALLAEGMPVHLPPPRKK